MAGLVAITPACGFITPVGSIFLGLIAGAVCALAVSLKYRFGFDDSLDVVGVHLVGGIIGTLLVGFLGTHSVNAAALGEDGLFYGGGLVQLGRQAIAAGSVLVYSFVCALVIGYIIKFTIGFRISEEDEVTGIDETEHAETSYDYSTLGGGLGLSSGHPLATASQHSSGTVAAGKEG